MAKIKASVIIEITTQRDKSRCSHRCKWASANRFDEVSWCRLFETHIDARTSYRTEKCVNTFKEPTNDNS